MTHRDPLYRTRLCACGLGSSGARSPMRLVAGHPGRLGDKWHLDEAVVSIGGKKHWPWRAVDQDGFVLEIMVQSRGNAKAPGA